MTDNQNSQNNKPIPTSGQSVPSIGQSPPIGQGPATGRTTDQTQSSSSSATIVSSTLPGQQSNVPVYQPHMEMIVPTVATTAEAKGTPTLFYTLFAIVLVVFIAVTTFMVLNLRQKKTTESLVVPTVIPTITASISTEPTSIVTPTEVKKPVSESDEVVDIEAEFKNTDLSVLGQELDSLDRKMGLTSQ